MSSFNGLIERAKENYAGSFSGQNSTASQSAKSSGNKPVGYSGLIERSLASFSDVDNDYLDRFVSDYNSFLEEVQENTKSISYEYGKHIYDSHAESLSDLIERSNAVSSYMKLNPNASEEQRKEAQKISDTLNRFMKDFKSTQELYAQYDTEEAFNTAKQQAEWQEKYKGKDSRELESLLGGVEDEEEQKWLQDYSRYLDYQEKKNLDTVAYAQAIRQLQQQMDDYDYDWTSSSERQKAEADMEKMGDELDQKKAYLHAAKQIQQKEADKEKFEAIRENADFEAFKGFDGSNQEIGYRYVNADAGERAELERVYGQYAEEFGYHAYDSLNPEEKEIYNYLMNTGDRQGAADYLKYLQEDLNVRKAQQTFQDGYEDQKALEYVFGIEAGLDQFRSGIQGFGNLVAGRDEYVPASYKQNLSGMIREDLEEGKVMLPDTVGGGSLGQGVYDTITTSANMAPSILTSVAVGMLNPVAGEWAGSALMGMSAAGSAYQEAVNSGFTRDQAKGYGLLIGGSEMVLGKLLGGISKLGGNALGKNLAGNLAAADTALKMVGRQLGGSMLSEFSEEWLQEVLTPVFRNITLGTNEDVKPFSPEALYAGILGAITSVVMEGPSAVGEAKGIRDTGRKLQEAGITGERLAELGSTFSADTVAYKLAGKVDANTDAFTLGRLFNEMGASLSEQNKVDITNALITEGMDPDMARKHAEVLGYIVDGGKLSDVQMKMIQKNDVLARVVKRVLVDENSTVNQRMRGMNEAAQTMSGQAASSAGSEAQTSGGEQKQSKGDVVDSKKEKTTQNEYGASADGKTIEKTTGKAVQIREIESIKDGKMTLKLTDGRTVKAEDVDYASESEALVYSAVAQMNATPKAANVLVKGFQAVQKDGMAASDYAHGLDEAYRYGKLGVPASELKKSTFASRLNPGQQDYAYRQGMKAAGKQTAKEQAAVRQVGNKNRAPAKPVAKQGGVFYEGRNGSITDWESAGKNRTLTAKQESAVQAMKVLSKALGVKFYVFESYRNSKGELVFRDRTGKEKSMNGYYDRKDGSIHIDLNAGKDGSGTMLFTMAHEMTHFIKQWSPAKFKALANFLAERYSEVRNVDELVQAKMKDTGLGYDDAYEEVVADAMESMLTDGNVIEKLAELKQQDKSIWQKIRDFIDNWAAKLKEAYQGLTPDSAEGRDVARMVDAVEKLQELFADGLVEASENYQSSLNPGEDGVTVAASERSSAQKSEKPYSYQQLISKPDMLITTVGGNVPTNRADVVAEAKQNAAKVGKFDSRTGSVSVHVDDISSDVLLGTDGLKHGLRRTKDPQNDANYIVTLKAGEIIKNSIKINEANPKKQNATGAIVLIGVAGDRNGNLYIVRSVVNQFKNELDSMDVLYAINAKKELAATKSPRSTAEPLSVTSSTISIAELLDHVNAHFPDILPEEVLKHYGYDSRPEGDFGENVLYQKRESESVSNRSLLANALESAAVNDSERKRLQEYKAKIGEIQAAEEKLRELNAKVQELSFTKGPRDKQKIFDLQLEAKQTANRINIYDKQLLRLEATKPLQDVLRREQKAAYDRGVQKGKEALEAYRVRAEKKQQETVKQHQESRKRSMENRKKTEMRARIRKVIRDLDQILNRGDKKRNVKEGMKDFVAEALASAEILFMDNYSNEDMIRNGITVEVSAEENRLIDDTQKLLNQRSDLHNISAILDTENIIVGNSENYNKRMKESDKISRQIAENMRKLKGVFERERNRLNNATVSSVLDSLADAYWKLYKADEGYIRGAVDDVVYQHLQSLRDTVKGTVVQDMTMKQLEELHKAYTMVMTTIRNANKAFVDGRSIQTEAEQLVAELQSVKKPDKDALVVLRNAINSIGWNYEKFYYALERIGSPTLKKLFGNLAEAENITMQDVQEAKTFQAETVEKHHYNDWSVDKKIDHTFVDNNGKEFQLTLGEMMSLYAYSRREGADKHIEVGGFTFGKKALTDPKPADTYKLTADQVAKITSMLTPEQKAFAEAMQKFLTEVMGEKGNEVTMKLYGIKLFTEENYWPLHIAGEYKVKVQEAQAQAEEGFKTMANAGFTHARNMNSTAPIVLEGFMEVWADHVNEMSRYHGAVPALEDIRRVMNYSVYSESTSESVSVTAALTNAYGEKAVEYFDRLYREANSGAVREKMVTIPDKALSLFRKGSVAYSLSVVIQQPASIYRAQMLVDKKYFGRHGLFTLSGGTLRILNRKKWNASYAEMMKYAPGVTMAKEIGGFDTSTGNSIRSYLLDTEKTVKQEWQHGTAKQKVRTVMGLVDDNLIANLPNVMDKIAWIEMWEACKRETVTKNHNLSTGTEEFMQKVGQRFTEVVRATQVYDSMFSKSPMLNSKNTGVQALVSFMNESNTVANMAEDAVRKLLKGDKKQAAKTAAALISSIVATNALKSAVYAMRDDDEDETWWEKYVRAFAGNLISDINPFNYIPVARDVVSVLQGYDVERTDMAIITDVIKAAQALKELAKKDTANMSEKELEQHNKKLTDAQWRVAETLAVFTGIPLKNIRRDIIAVANTVKTARLDSERDTTKLSFRLAVEEGLLGSNFSANKLYEAIVAGDKELERRIRGEYDQDNEYRSAVRKALRENDQRITDAAIAWNNNDLETYQRIADEIIGEGYFTKTDVREAINTKANSLDKTEKEPVPEKEKSLFNAEKFAVAISQDNTEMAESIKTDIIDTAKVNGDDAEDAEKSFNSSAKSALKKLYLDKGVSEDQVSSALKDYCDMSRSDAEQLIREWDFENNHEMSYSEMFNEYEKGNVTERDMRAAMKEIGMKEYEIAEKLRSVQENKAFLSKFEMTFSEARDLYMNDQLNRSKMREMLIYDGKTQMQADDTLIEWDIAKKFDIPYDKLDDAYKYGDISRQELYSAMIANGETPKKAEEATACYDWLKARVKEHPDLQISDARKFVTCISETCDEAEDYTLTDFGISENTYKEYKTVIADAHGVDEDGDGETDNGTLRDAKFDIINRMSISKSQKDALAMISYSMKSIRRYAPWH